jgi:hypothetical protein
MKELLRGKGTKSHMAEVPKRTPLATFTLPYLYNKPLAVVLKGPTAELYLYLFSLRFNGNSWPFAGRYSDPRLELTTTFHPVLKLRISGATPSLPHILSLPAHKQHSLYYRRTSKIFLTSTVE